MQPMTKDTDNMPATRPEMSRHSFLGIELEIAGGVLIPREETELLGRTAIGIVANSTSPLVIDMCCGSGNLGLAIASAVPSAKVMSADLTDETVNAARHNTQRLGLSDRVEVYQGDLFAAFGDKSPAGKVDLVVCNPPYISAKRLHETLAHLLEEEPREAFDGGPFGISILQRLVRDSADMLRPGGSLAFEFGEGQHHQVAHLLSRSGAYEEISFVDNELGIARVAIARKK
ncbi:release factor glutamine methyltransferase [Phyllobacterium ifriqiyense]|uniref:peptide chain release factor N(5)-glutamine methyltransferase n=1 Tax=Phyllobacterium ifriqiyense TaxID=314238 RepID=A0ABU0S313_9HYPH|nr:HemK/PrmC family methyltransferase [Phyllobacterium ifriqiyense]MDQ0995021.1 release factor glutamine methyltransferase [Phyllobacterium ifriqiyense]